MMGYGTEDENVLIKLGREVASCLGLVRANVQVKEYQGLVHWYSEHMPSDIFGFIRQKPKIETSSKADDRSTQGRYTSYLQGC